MEITCLFQNKKGQLNGPLAAAKSDSSGKEAKAKTASADSKYAAVVNLSEVIVHPGVFLHFR